MSSSTPRPPPPSDSPEMSAPPRSAPGPALAVVTAAGSGTRLGWEGPKALAPIAGVPMVRRAVAGLVRAGVAGVVVTAPEGALTAFRQALAGVARTAGQSAPAGRDPDAVIRVVAGSTASRQASVALGLEALPALAESVGIRLSGDTPVLVHDAARCLTPADVVRRVIDAVSAGAVAVVPGLPVTDTLKEVEPANGRVIGTPDRSRLRAVQTPQGFTWNELVGAHRAAAMRAGAESTAATDDAGLVEALGLPVVIVDGDVRALKVTTPLDLALADLLARRS